MMPRPRFFSIAAPATAGSICDHLASRSGVIDGLPEGTRSGVIDGVADPASPDLGGKCVFITDSDHLTQIDGRHPGLILIPPKLAETWNNANNSSVLIVEDARFAFIQVANLFYGERCIDGDAPLHHPTARIATSAIVHPTAVIGADARIHEDCAIGPHVVIGPGVEIGANSVIEPNVTISHAILGRECRIYVGARIGQAGFGFHQGPDGPVRVPQLGAVLVGDGVEVGANATIDRGALGDTIIGDGTSIDNLVQIAHNVRIGQDCMIAAQTGISGSCTIGHGVMFGGKVGLANHLTIGDGARLAADAGVMHDVPAGETWAGTPAKPIKAFMREVATLKKLATEKKRKTLS